MFLVRMSRAFFGVYLRANPEKVYPVRRCPGWSFLAEESGHAVVIAGYGMSAFTAGCVQCDHTPM